MILKYRFIHSSSRTHRCLLVVVGSADTWSDERRCEGGKGGPGVVWAWEGVRGRVGGRGGGLRSFVGDVSKTFSQLLHIAQIDGWTLILPFLYTYFARRVSMVRSVRFNQKTFCNLFNLPSTLVLDRIDRRIVTCIVGWICPLMPR